VFDWGLLLFFFGGVSTVFWVFDGVSTVFWVFFVGFGFLGVVGVLVLVGFVGFFLWASWIVPVYTNYVLRGALRFFNKILFFNNIYKP